MFDGVEHVAIARPNPPALAQWNVDYPAFRQILHLIQCARPFPE